MRSLGCACSAVVSIATGFRRLDIYVRQNAMASPTIAMDPMAIVKQKKIAPRPVLGRPITIGANRAIGIRLPMALLKRVDNWAKRQRVAKRSKAIRLLLEKGLLK
jgi:hypothetical protein